MTTIVAETEQDMLHEHFQDESLRKAGYTIATPVNQV